MLENIVYDYYYYFLKGCNKIEQRIESGDHVWTITFSAFLKTGKMLERFQCRIKLYWGSKTMFQENELGLTPYM